MENYYIVRCDRAGVFFGKIKSREGREVTMTNARRLWRWDGANELCQMANEGTSRPKNCKFSVHVGEIVLLDAIEIIPCTTEAIASIEGVPEWKM